MPLTGLMHTLPILFLPGIMGTRLVDPNGNYVWNPTGATSVPLVGWVKDLYEWGDLAADEEILTNLELKCTPSQVDDSNDEQIEEAALQRHRIGAGIIGPDYFSLVPDFYATGLDALANWIGGNPLRDRFSDLKLPLYVAGYDWRQSNVRSAASLAERIASILRHNECDNVILVCHSMGGLIARYFCTRYWPGDHSKPRTDECFRGQDKVAGVIQIGSPTFGAVKPFLLLKTGKTGGGDNLQFLYLFNKWGDSIRDLARRIPSLYQLLPTATFAAHYPAWLRLNEQYLQPWRALRERHGLTLELPLSSPEDLYFDQYAGLLDVGAQGHVIEHLNERSRFAKALGDYVHPNTYAIYSTEKMTICAAQIHEKDSAESIQLESADGSVPLLSAKAAGLPLQERLEGGGEHGDMCNHPRTIKAVQQALEWIILPHFARKDLPPRPPAQSVTSCPVRYPRSIVAAVEWNLETVLLLTRGEKGRDPLKILLFSLSNRRVEGQRSLDELPWLMQKSLSGLVDHLNAAFSYGEPGDGGVVMFGGLVYLQYDRTIKQVLNKGKPVMQHSRFGTQKLSELVIAALRYDHDTVLLITNLKKVLIFDLVNWRVLTDTESFLSADQLQAFKTLALKKDGETLLSDGFNNGAGTLYLFRAGQYALWNTDDHRVQQDWTKIPEGWELA